MSEQAKSRTPYLKKKTKKKHQYICNSPKSVNNFM